MIKQKIRKRRLLAIAAIVVLLMTVAGIIFMISNNGLALEQPSSSIKLDDIDWASEDDTSFNFRSGELAPSIEGLPTKDHAYFTNVDLTDKYQFVQTATNSWTEQQRLFWRKDSASTWQEIRLTEKDVSPSSFVTKNGRQYLAAIGGLLAEDRYLYLIDVEKGTFQKQFQADDLFISPDATKILCDGNNSMYAMGYHAIFVLDLEDGSKTRITNLTEASPGSGRSFNYTWSSENNYIEIEGTSHDNPLGFRYIYDHESKKLFSI